MAKKQKITDCAAANREQSKAIVTLLIGIGLCVISDSWMFVVGGIMAVGGFFYIFVAGTMKKTICGDCGNPVEPTARMCPTCHQPLQ